MSVLNIPITDQRVGGHHLQAQRLVERFYQDNMDDALVAAKFLSGKYSDISPTQLSVVVVPGGICGGQVNHTVIQVQLPEPQEILPIFRRVSIPVFQLITEAQAQEVALAMTVSTIVHLGCEAMINVESEALLVQDMERISGVYDALGERAQIVKQGLAYAFQGVYDLVVPPLNTIKPRVTSEDDEITKHAKILGGKIESMIKTYLTEKKPIDDDFLLSVLREIVQV